VIDLAATLRDVAVDAPERFLLAWHGEPNRVGVSNPSPELDLPEPIRRLHEAASRWPKAIVQNELVPPRLDGDRIVFYVENQGVYEWGAMDDRVWGRAHGDPNWVEEEASLTAFILELLVFEAIMGADHGGSVAHLSREGLDAVVAPLDPMPHGAWRWPSYPTRFFGGGRGVLVMAGPNPPGEDGFLSVFLGAREADAIAYLDDVVDERWEWFSRRDST
jgi:hypothetical protein